jgi:hypothetical protein
VIYESTKEVKAEEEKGEQIRGADGKRESGEISIAHPTR